jgi:NitT/TauT family transport system permease protein
MPPTEILVADQTATGATAPGQAARRQAPASTGADQAAASLHGLDALSVQARRRTRPGRRLARAVLPPVVAVLLILTAWQVAVLVLAPAPDVFPDPASVWQSLRDGWSQGTVQEAIGNSLSRGAIGFAIAVSIGAPLGLLIARVRLVRAAIGPIVSSLQSLPSVAWVPAAILWFQLSSSTIYFVVLLGAVPSVANGLVAGLDQVPPLFDRVGKVLGAGRLAAIRFVLLPAALPGFIAGLKQGWAFAWRSLMAAELITYSPKLGTGLGQLLDQGRELHDMSQVFASILLILVVGLAIELVVFAPLERHVLRSRGLLVDQT